MSSSFFIGLSGLRANSTALNVVGNNLANLNTTAFKSNVISFQEMMQSSLGRPGMQSGMGVSVAGSSQVITQGALQSTALATDMAIIGSGFFVLSNGQHQSYTRAGDFTLDAQGNLRTQRGLFVQGYPATDGVVSTSGTLRNIQLTPGMAIQPRATTSLSVGVNLNANAQDGDTFSSTIDVFDSLGSAHTVTLTFTKGATANDWTYSITVPGADVGSTDPTVEINAGSLTFDGLGKLTAPTADVEDITIAGLANGASDITFTWKILDPAGTPMLTQFSAPSNTSAASQDGFAFGTLGGFQVNDQGVIQGTFTNGQVRALGQIALANFNNPQGLIRQGQSTFITSDSSGAPIIGAPGTGGRGGLVGNALELSNVDIAQEFTNMILAQRGYQASSRVITTTDDLIQEALNLKR